MYFVINLFSADNFDIKIIIFIEKVDIIGPNQFIKSESVFKCKFTFEHHNSDVNEKQIFLISLNKNFAIDIRLNFDRSF